MIAQAPLVILSGDDNLLRPQAPAIAALAISAIARRRGRDRAAFLGSAAFLASALAGVGASLFPVLLRSAGGGRDLTAYAAAARGASLTSGAPWYLVSLVLVAAYFVNVFRHHRGKVVVPKDDEH